MKIKLSKKCTIRQLENRKGKLEKSLGGKKAKIAIDVSALEKIDTAFLQALLSIIESCKRSGKKYEILGRSAAFDLILECYGITI
ncbi:MAG: STAS domain-containing protein [Leptospiraceae bacterium]|nr:STAS domain-containing protein [Leptospiraceae bacterium]